MLIRSLTGLVAAAVLGLVTGCSTPCDASGRLCAPAVANTSTQAGVPPKPELPRQAEAPAPVPAAASRPAQAAVTRIALLLPVKSASLGAPAEAVRAGFMAAWERDRTGFAVNLIPTGDSPQEALRAYTAALQQHELIVGPLARNAVTAIAASGAVTRPTVALNHPDRGTASSVLPRRMVAIGLSIEDEARQVADWAAAEHPRGRALVLVGSSTWQRRIAGAFNKRWDQLGHAAQVVELSFPNGYLDPTALAELRSRIEIDPPNLLFAALDAIELRQVRAGLGTQLACYGTSSVNPGSERGASAPELNGVRMLDLPWQVEPDHPAVMVYPRARANGQQPDIDRLYALGIDAFRIAREIALQDGAAFALDGVTGKLTVDPGTSTFERVEAATVYQDGAFAPVALGR